MPTPDGRAWLTSSQLVSNLLDTMRTTHPSTANYIDLHRTELQTDLEPTFADLYSVEFKVARLCEQLRDACDNGTITTFEEVHQALKDIYTQSVLDQYDEDGNYIGG